MVSLRAIRPKRFRVIDPIRTETEVRAGIRIYLEEVKQELQNDYNKVPPGRTYKRKGYSGGVRGGWKISVPSHNYGLLINDVPWAVYVQGPFGGGRGKGSRQARNMRSRGWQSITEVSRRTRKHFEQLMNRAVHPRVIG